MHGVPATAPHKGFAGHPQVTVFDIEIDEAYADLLPTLWKLGLDTQYSCQGHPAHFVPNHEGFWDAGAQILFTDAEQGLKFIRKSVELLGNDAYHEGGYKMHVCQGIDSPVPRGDVRFSPELIEPLTVAWVAFEAELTQKEAAKASGIRA